MMSSLDEELRAGSDSSSSKLPKDAWQIHRHEGTVSSAGEGPKTLDSALVVWDDKGPFAISLRVRHFARCSCLRCHASLGAV